MTETDGEARSELAEALDLAERRARCDAACKLVFSHKAVLAHILRACVEEFGGCTPEEIEPLIGDVMTGSVAVARGMTSRSVSGGVEDSTLGEGTVRYDVAFRASVPGGRGGKVGLVVNVEAQGRTNPGYSLHSRAAYYCARLLSAQFGIDLSNADYGGLQRVYSIWICMNAPKGRRNSVNEYRLTELNREGPAFGNDAGADLMRIVMVCPGDPDRTHDLLRMLGIMLSNELRADEKRRLLSTEFDLPMTGDLDREVCDMCDLSDGFYEKGLEKGIEQGMEQGLEQGMEKMLLENIRSLMATFQLSLDKAMDALNVSEEFRPAIRKALA